MLLPVFTKNVKLKENKKKIKVNKKTKLLKQINK